MSQLFRRKPIAALLANEGTERVLERVLGAVACGFIMVGPPPQVWERLLRNG